jgi:L-asparaginase
MSHGDPTGPIRPVPVLLAALGDDGSVFRAAGDNQRAVVVAANGAGNLPPKQAAAVQELIDGGRLVVLTTRAADGRVAPVYGYPGGVAGLVEHGAQLAAGISPHRARLLVTLGLAQGRDNDGLRALIDSEIRA